jgi:predicted metal-binding transcription factor (methanogenesis marker protein 9)
MRVTIDLSDEEYMLLKTRAAKEMRSIRSQIAYDVREATSTSIKDRSQFGKLSVEAEKYARKALVNKMKENVHLEGPKLVEKL